MWDILDWLSQPFSTCTQEKSRGRKTACSERSTWFLPDKDEVWPDFSVSCIASWHAPGRQATRGKTQQELSCRPCFNCSRLCSSRKPCAARGLATDTNTEKKLTIQHVHAYMHACLHACKHTYICTFTYIHTHILSLYTLPPCVRVRNVYTYRCTAWYVYMYLYIDMQA